MVSAKEIPPGGEGEVKAVLNTRGRSGRLQKSIRVQSNDPARPLVTLMIAVTVTAEVMVTPKVLHFGTVKRGDKPTRTLTVKFRKGTAGRIQSVKSGTGTVVPKVLETPATDGATQIEVSLKPDVKPGRFVDHLIIETTSAKKPQVRVSVSGHRQGDLVARPRHIGFSKKNRERSVEVTKTNPAGPDFRVTGASVNAAGFKVDVSEMQPGAKYQVTVAASQDAKFRPRPKLIIRTDNQEQPELEVGIFGSLEGPRLKRPVGPLLKTPGKGRPSP